jgi:hypothetical protein
MDHFSNDSPDLLCPGLIRIKITVYLGTTGNKKIIIFLTIIMDGIKE